MTTLLICSAFQSHGLDVQISAQYPRIGLYLNEILSEIGLKNRYLINCQILRKAQLQFRFQEGMRAYPLLNIQVEMASDKTES